MSHEFNSRAQRREKELGELYSSLYCGKERDYEALTALLRRRYAVRPRALKEIDRRREAEPGWYKSTQLLGMCLYVDRFAGTLRGVRDKLGYLRECGVNYLHLMPFLDTVDGRSDGGYAVASFRKVKPQLGTMADLEALTADCHAQGMSVCMDFVMNHTSEDHILSLIHI